MTINISIDCMGGDHGVSVTLPACRAFLDSHPYAELVLVGRADALQPAAKWERCSLIPATEGVEMDDSVEVALRRKKGSSMRMAISQVKPGPDGAAVDSQGCYWSAMYEGQCLVRYSPEGQELQTIELPVRCPTMPCFGGPDLRSLYLTTARDNRPEQELNDQPWAGRVLKTRVEVPGLPLHAMNPPV